MTTFATDNQFGFGAPKNGASIEVPRNPHMDHLFAVTDEAVDLLDRHSHKQDLPVVMPEVSAEVTSSTGINTEVARGNVDQVFKDQIAQPEYEEYEAA